MATNGGFTGSTGNGLYRLVKSDYGIVGFGSATYGGFQVLEGRGRLG